MSKKVQIKLNRAGVQALLRSNEIGEAVKIQANRVLGKAGDGYAVKHKVGKNRQIYTVYADTYKAAKDNLDNNTLLKAVGK